MINEFDITSFGAVGDGVTDCTNAVQQALDRASECMGVVVVPPGKYMVGELHIHGENVSIKGTSAWTFRDDGASILCLNNENADCMINITGAFGCAIRGVCLNGQKLGKNIHGIKLYWDKYNGGGKEDTPVIDDCRITNFTGDGVHFEHVWCFSVRHSMIGLNDGAGLLIDGWDGFILDNWFTANKNGGVLGGAIVAALTLTGNRVEWNRRGGFVFPNGMSTNITGNFFDRSFGPGLLIGCKEENSCNISATGNIFHRNGAYATSPYTDPYISSHVRLENCSGVVVSGNSMRVREGDEGKGPYSPDYAIVIEDCKETIVKDNALWQGACVENVVLKGDNSTCIIKDNVGSLMEI